MTPKEKAAELFDRYRDIDMPSMCNYATIGRVAAKECVLIAVDEIIGTLSPYFGDNNARSYWKEVKQEIEKL